MGEVGRWIASIFSEGVFLFILLFCWWRWWRVRIKEEELASCNVVYNEVGHKKQRQANVLVAWWLWWWLWWW